MGGFVAGALLIFPFKDRQLVETHRRMIATVHPRVLPVTDQQHVGRTESGLTPGHLGKQLHIKGCPEQALKGRLHARRNRSPLAPRLLVIRPTMRAVSYPGPERLRVLDKPEPAMEHPKDAVVRVARYAQDSSRRPAPQGACREAGPG